MRGTNIPTLGRIGGKMIRKLLAGDTGALVFRNGRLALAVGCEIAEPPRVDQTHPELVTVEMIVPKGIVQSLVIAEGTWIGPGIRTLEAQAHESQTET